MPSLWFPVEELISDKVDRAKKSWDARVTGQTIKAGADQIAEPLIQDRIGSAMSRFDTLTAGPARGLLGGLSGPSGPLTALNPIAAGSAIGSDLFPKAGPAIEDRIGKATSALDARLKTPAPISSPRKPIETPGLGLSGLGLGIEEKIKGAGSKFDTLIGGAGSALKQRDADFNARLGREGIDLGTGSTIEDFVRDPLGATRKEWDYRPKPLPLRGNEGAIEGGLIDTANQMRESYNFTRDKPERLTGAARTILEHTSVPGAINSAARAQRERPGDKKAYLSELGDVLETAGHVGNLIPTGEDTLQNVGVNIGVRALTEHGVNPLVASGISVVASMLAPGLLPLAKRGVIKINANAEQLIGQALPNSSLMPGVLTSGDKSRMGAMQQINQMRTGTLKDGITSAFPFEYNASQVRNSKAARSMEYASSSTELEAMMRLDNNSDVVSWRRPDKVEDIVPYTMPNGETGSYVPDFLVKYKDGRTELIEIKAAFRENTRPVQARSEAAQRWAKEKGYEYALVTERELGEFSLKARAKEDPSLFTGLSPHMAQKFQSLIERSGVSASKYGPRAFDPTRVESMALRGRAQPPTPSTPAAPGAKGRPKPQPLTADDLEVLDIIRQQQLDAGNVNGAKRTLDLITETRVRLGLDEPGGPRGTSSDLTYPEPEPDDPNLVKAEERYAGKQFLTGTAIRGGVGASAGAASGAIYGEKQNLSPEDRATAIGAGAIGGLALGMGAHVAGYQGLAALIDAGKVNPQYLQGHPDLANRVRAIMLAAAERTPAGQPVQVPAAVKSLEGLQVGNGGAAMTPELLRLTSGQLTPEQVREAIGRITPLAKVKQAAKDLIADAVSGIPTRFSRAEEYRADKSALYNLQSVGVDRATSVEDLVRRVADAVGTATPHVKIIDSPDANAFAPINGQPLQLTTGLMNLGLSREELGWIIAHELVHTTTEGRSKRMNWSVSRAIEKAGKAQGQASEGLAARFATHSAEMNQRLERFDVLSAEIKQVKQQIESRTLLAESAKAGNGIERPPAEGVWASWGGRITDNDLMEIAARSGIEQFGPQWWEALDPEAVRIYRAEAMAERGPAAGRRAAGRSKGKLQADQKRLELEQRQLEQQLEQDLNIQSTMQEQAATEGVDLTLDDEVEAPDAPYDDYGASEVDPNRFARPIEGTDAGPITEPEPVAKQELAPRKAEQNALDLGDQSVAPTTAPLVNPKNQTQLGMGLDVPEAPPKASAAARRTEADRAGRGLRQGELPPAVVGPEMAIEHWTPLVRSGEVSQQMVGYELGQAVGRGDMTPEEAAQIKAALKPYYEEGQQTLKRNWDAHQAAQQAEAAPVPEPEPPTPTAVPEPPAAPAAPAASRFSPEEITQSRKDIRQAIADGVITAEEANAKIDELVRTGEIDQAAADQIRPGYRAPRPPKEVPLSPEAVADINQNGRTGPSGPRTPELEGVYNRTVASIADVQTAHDPDVVRMTITHSGFSAEDQADLLAQLDESLAQKARDGIPPWHDPERAEGLATDFRALIDSGEMTEDQVYQRLQHMQKRREIGVGTVGDTYRRVTDPNARAAPATPTPTPEPPTPTRVPETATPEISGDAAAAQARSAARAAEFGSTSDFNPQTYTQLMDEYGPQLKNGENFIEGIEKDLARREAAGEVDYDTAKEVIEDLRRQNGLSADTTVPETPPANLTPEAAPLPEGGETTSALPEPEWEGPDTTPEGPDLTLRPETQPLPDTPETASDIGTMIEPGTEIPEAAPPPAPVARAERGPSRKQLRNQAQQHVDQMLDSGEMTPDEIDQAITDMADAGTYTDQQAMEAKAYLDKQLNMRAVNGHPETGPIPGQIDRSMGRQLDRRTPPPVEGRRGKAKEPEGTVIYEPGEEGSSGYGDVTTNRPTEAPPREPGRAPTPDEFAAEQAADVARVMDETAAMSMEDALAHIDDKVASGEISQTVGNRAAAQVYDKAGQFKPVPAPEPEPVRAPGAPENYPPGAPWPPPESGRPVPENYPVGPEGSAGMGDVTTPEAQAAEAAYPKKKSTLGVPPEDIIEPEPVPPRVPPTAEVAPPSRPQPPEPPEVPPPATPRPPDVPDGTGAPPPPLPPDAPDVPPPPPPSDSGTPPPPPDPKGPRPDNWPAGVPWPPPFDPKKEPGKWAAFWTKLDQARYASNLLFRPAGGFRDLLGTLFSVSLALPRTEISSVLEEAGQGLGKIQQRERSAVAGQSFQMLKAFGEGAKKGKAAAADVWQKGMKSRYASTPDIPNASFFGEGRKGKIANRIFEGGYRIRLASDAFNAHIGEEIATAGLAYREAVRAGLKRGTKEFDEFRSFTQANLKSEMRRQADEAYQAGARVTQGPVRPRGPEKPAPPGMPRQQADTDTEGLAQEAFGIAKGLIFQGAPGTMTKGVSALTKGAIKGPIPFFTTLAQVGGQYLEHHPITGLGGTALDLARSQGKAGDRFAGPYSKMGTGPNAGNRFTSSNSAAVRPASQRLASATMGAGAAGVGYALVANNLMTDGGPSDTSVKRKMMDEGWRPYAFKIPDGQGGVQGYVPIEWFLGPLAGAVGFGAEQASRNAKGEDVNLEQWTKILVNQSSQWAGMSGFRPIYDVVNALSAPDEGEKLRAWEDMTRDLIGGSIPGGGIVKALNNVMGDEYQRDPRTFDQWLASQIPGLREDVPYRRTEYGERIERGGTLTRLWNEVSPATYSERDPGTRAYYGSKDAATDAEITAATNAVDNYDRHPDQYKPPTRQQRTLAGRFEGLRNVEAEFDRTQETEERRRRKARQSSSVQSILRGDFGAILGGGGGGGGTGGGFVPPTSASRPRFEIPRVGG